MIASGPRSEGRIARKLSTPGASRGDGRNRSLTDRPRKRGHRSGKTKSGTMTAMPKPRVRLSDDERKKFDSIGLDDINSMVDVAELHKLHRYME